MLSWARGAGGDEEWFKGRTGAGANGSAETEVGEYRSRNERLESLNEVVGVVIEIRTFEKRKHT